jgi:hypothetical protein
MANLLPFLLMSQQQAARFREETAADDNKLDPRLIDAGPYAGWYALPRRVMDDPAHATRHDAFLMLQEVDFDTDEAWPPSPEE